MCIYQLICKLLLLLLLEQCVTCQSHGILVKVVQSYGWQATALPSALSKRHQHEKDLRYYYDSAAGWCI